MASNRDLRPIKRQAKAGRLAVPRDRRLLTAAALAAAALVCLALTQLASLTRTHGTHEDDRSATPAFLARTLGAPQPGAALVREPARGVRVSIGPRGYTVRRQRAGAVSLASTAHGGAWRRFERGATRPTPFGSETVTVSPTRTEELLTVHERQGVRTWSWRLGTLDLEPRSRRNGRIDLADAGGVVRLSVAPVSILDRDGRDVTPAGLRWTVARTAAGEELRLRLDDRRLALPYTIDPAVDYPTPLYLSSTASTETGSWRLLGTAPSAADSTTSVVTGKNATGYYLFQPGVNGNASAGTPSSTPAGTGFVLDTAGSTGIAPGSWSFTLTGTNLASANGTAVFAVGIWKGTISGGVFTSTGLVMAPTDDPAAQNVMASATTTYTVTYPSVPAISLGSNDRLYVEVWLHQTAGNSNGAAKNREVNLVVNDGTAQIVHPAADDVAPTHAFSLNVVSGGAWFSNPGGTSGTVYYRGSAAGSFTLSDAAVDSNSGAKQVTYPAPGGSLTHAAQTVATGPSFTSAAYTWSAGGTTSPGAQAIVAQDNALNSTTGSPVTITNDSTAPTGQAVALTAPPAWYTTASVGLTPTDGSDAGSGLDTSTRVYQRDETTMTGGVCNAFPGTWTTVSNPDATVQSGKCYRYRFAISDRVGNQSAWSAVSATAKVDLAGPTAPILTVGSPTNAYASGSTVYYRPGVAGSFTVTASGSTDAASGLSSYTFPSFFTTGGSGASRTYSWSGTPAAPGAQTVTPVDVAGNSGSGATFTPTADASLPATSDDTGAIGSGWKTASQTVTLTPTDTGSGVQATYYTTDGSTPTTSSASGTSVSLSADGTYTVEYFSVDRVGNAEAVATAGTQIRIDRTAPSTATLAALPAAIRNGQALTATAADATSGVQDVTYYYCAGAACTPATSLGSSSTGPAYSVTWSSQPADGTYRVLARVRDNAGLTRDSAIQTVTIDNTAPTASIDSKPASSSANAAPGFSFSSPDGTASFECRLDGAAFAACTSPKSYASLADGSHTFDVHAKDVAGNTSADTSWTWTIDTAAPGISLDSKPPALSTNASPGFSFSSADATATFECRLDGGAFAACTSPKSYASLADGSHTFDVHAVDAAGNTSADAGWTWTIDTAAPDVSLDAKPADPSSSTGPSFAFSSTDGTASFQCRLDGAAFAACTSPKSYASLAAGSHTFAVYAQDAAGNTSAAASWTWTIDTTAPSTPVLTPSTSGASVWYAGSGSTVWFRPGAGASDVVTIAAAATEGETSIASWSFPALPGFTRAGSGSSRTYTASAPTAADGGTGTVTATNTAGLTSAAASFTLSPDATAPAGGSISGAPAYDADGSFSFTVAADTDGDSGIASQTLARETATLSGDACTGWSADGAVALAATVSQTSLPAPACYRYVLTATDRVGNVHTVTSSVVEVDASAPSTPTLTLSDAGANVHYPGSGSTVWFKPGADGTNVVTVAGSASDAQTGVSSWSFAALPGFTLAGSGATRTYTASAPAAGDGGSADVAATNAAGLASANATFTLAADATAPGGGSISNVPAVDGDGSFSFDVATDTDGGSGVASQTLRRERASLAGDVCGSFADDGAVTLAATVAQSGLSAGCYRYVLTTTDNVGNVDTIVSPAVKLDTTAPTVPALTLSTAGGNLSYPGSGTTVWFRPGAGAANVVTIGASTTEDETAVASWAFPTLAGFTLSGSGATRTYTAAAPGATDGGNGGVTATNSAGLESAAGSFSLTADADAPTGGSLTGLPAYDTDGSFSLAVATDSDALSGVASQTLTREKATLSGDACTSWASDGAVTIAASVDESGLAAPACYRYVLTATDRVGNVDTITSSVVEVDATAPSTPTLALSTTGSAVHYPGSGSTVWFRPGAGAANTVTVTGSATDDETGVASWSFPALGGFSRSGSGASSTYTAASPLAGDGGSGSVTATNGAGIDSPAATLTFTADAAAPTSALSFPADGAVYDAAAWTGTLTGTASDTGGATLASTEVSIERGGSCWDGGAFAAACPAWQPTGGTAAAWTYAFTPPADGSYTVTVRATDAVGNADSATTATFEYDSTAPALQSAAVAADGTTVTVTFDEPLDGGVGTSGSAFSVTPNGGAAIAGTGTVTYPAADEVRFSLASPVHYRDTLSLAYAQPASARLADPAGNEVAAGSLANAAIANGTDSGAPPTPVLGSPADALSTTDASPTLSATFADPDPNDTGKLVFQVCAAAACGSPARTFDSSSTSLAGGATGSAAVPAPALADGTWYWRARAVDSAGEASSFSAVRSFTVDTTPPSFVSANVVGTALTLTFDEPLDAGQAVANGAFSVEVDGTARALTGSPSIATDTVALTLASAVAQGGSVTVAYARPASAPWLQDALGNATAGFAAQPVTNGSSNTPPTATVSLSPSSPTTDDVVTATASTADADGDPVTVTYVWKLDNVVVPGATGSTFDLAANGGRDQTLTVVATPHDGIGAGTAATDQVTVANSAPVLDSVSIDNGSPRTGDTLTAVVAAHDADADALAYSYQWYRDGTPLVGQNGSTLNLLQAGNGDVGDELSVRVIADDGDASSASLDAAAVTVQDTPPTATVTLSAASPRTDDVLTATASGSDDDLQAVTFTYVWKVGGTVVAGATGSTLDLSTYADRGDVVTVEATPHAGGADGTAASASATVANTAPVVDSVAIREASPRTDDTLHADVGSHDDDDDTLTLAYQWLLDGSPIAGATAATLDLATTGDKGDRISVRVTPDDATDTGTTATSTQVTIANTAPTATLTLAPASPTTDQTLTATATGSDPDPGDTVSFTYAWKVDGTPVAGATGSTLDLATHADKGQTVTVEATPADGTDTGTTRTATTTVADTAPVVDSVTIDQAAPRTGDTLSASVAWHDDDLDPVTVSYQWTRNGQPLLGRTASTLDLGATGNGDRGDEIGVTVTVSDDDGAASAPVDAATVTVDNSTPGATVSLGSAAPATGDTLTATTLGSDADLGDTLVYTYVWTVAGVEVKRTTATAATTDSLDLAQPGFGDRGQAVQVEVTPGDGTATGTAATASATVANSVPTLSVALDDDAPRTDAVLTATATTADADASDTVRLTYVWKVNGATRKTTSSTLATTDTFDLGAAGNGDDGDDVTVEVTATDGTASSPTRTAAATVGVDHLPVATVTLDAGAPKTDETLTASVTASDADLDPVTLVYVWKVGSTVVRTSPATAALGDSLDLSAAGNGDRGDTVTVTVTPNDGYADGTPASDSATVANSVPVVDSVAIDQAGPRTNDTLTATVVAHDADTADTHTYAYQWLKDGSPIFGASGSTLDLSLLGNGDRGDAISLGVVADDGTAQSATVTSVPVTILNTAPSAAVSLDPAAPATDGTLSATAAGSDPDTGDTVTLAYSWTVAGAPLAGETGSTLALGPAGHGDKGQVVAVHVAASDGTDAGADATASATVANSAPTVAATSPAGGSLTRDATPTLAATFADVDGDTGSLDFRVCADSGCSTVVDTASSAAGLAAGAEGSAAVSAGALATDGSYWWQARSTDADGAASAWSAARAFVLDTTAPAVQVDTAPADPSGSPSGSVAFSGEPGAAFACSLDGAAFAACSSPLPLAGLADGDHDVRVRATDAAGNAATASAAWTVDTQDPTVSFASPAGQYVASATPVAAAASDTGTGVVSVDFEMCSNTSANCGTGVWSTIGSASAAPWSVAWPLPGDGSRALRATATDGAGHTATARLDVVVDATAPTGSLTDPGPYLRGTVGLAAAAADATSGVNGVDLQWSPAGAGTWTTFASDATAPYAGSLDTTALPGDGSYDLRVFVTDEAGNVFAAPLASPVLVDNTAPTAALTAPPAYVTGVVNLSSTSSDAGSGIDSVAYEYRPQGDATWHPTPAAWDTAALHGDVELRAVVLDRAGNETVTTPLSTFVDHDAPTTTDDAPSLWQRTAVTVHLSATDTESGVARSEYSVDGGPYLTGATVSIPAPADHSWDGTHTVAYRSVDVAGNVEAARSTQVRIDTTAPSASITDPGSLLKGTLTLASTTADAGSGIQSVTYQAKPSAADDTQWAQVAQPLDTHALADGVYDLRVVAVDNAQNGFASPALQNVRIDNTAPATTDDAPAGAASSDVTVTLAATDTGSGVASTSYAVDGGAAQSGTSVTIPAPSDHSNDGAHTIAYRSTDAAGNVEAERTATVVIDTTAPGGPALDPGSVLSGSVHLQASPSDDDVDSVRFEYSPAGAAAWTTIATVTAAPFEADWATGSVADGAYDLRIVVTDEAGNGATTDLPGKTVDNTAPSSAVVTGPAAGATVSGNVTITATGADATSGVASVALQVKPAGAAGFTTVTSPWDSTQAPDGPVEIRAVVTDVAGNSTTSASRTIIVDNDAPTIALGGVSGAVSGVANLTATTSADTASVTYERSPAGVGVWTAIGTSPAAPFGLAWTTTGVADGSYDLRAVAVDGSGNRGTSPTVTVSVDNAAPTATLTLPTPAATVGGPAVQLTATAADAGTGVASVTFRWRVPAGSWNLLPVSTSAPYAAAWDTTGLASGPYELSALAVDGAGNDFETPPVPVTVDTTAPTVSLAAIPVSVSGAVALSATTAGTGVARVVFQRRPAGGSTWTDVAAATTAPYVVTFDSAAVPDGDHDFRAVVSDAFGNSSSDEQDGVRVDNALPGLVASSPADGAQVSSLSSVVATASEPVASVGGAAVDGTPIAPPAIAGTTLTFATGALADGDHALTGSITDLGGHTRPFRVNFTVWSGSLPGTPAIAKNADPDVTTVVTAADATATVVMPAGAYAWKSPAQDDWLVLRIAPVPPSAVSPAAGMAPGAAIVDVTARWSQTGTLEHAFDAPLEIVIANTTGGDVVPATFENGVWRTLGRVDGSLPAGRSDGYFVDAAGVHVLTRHLSLFTLMRDLEPPAPPRDFAAVVAGDGLTLRWATGLDNSGPMQNFVLFVNGQPYANYGGTQFEAKLGAFDGNDTREFTLREVDRAGNVSAPTDPLLGLPPVAGMTLADATAALEARGFTVGAVRYDAASTAPAGTVVDPAGIQLRTKGSAIDLTVSGKADPVVQSRLAFLVAGQRQLTVSSRRTVAARLTISKPAQLVATLYGPRHVRLYTWRLETRAGLRIVRLRWPRQVRRPGLYTLVWVATAQEQTVRRTQKVRLLAKRDRHAAQAPKAKPTRVEIVVTGTAASTRARLLRALRRAHVQAASAEADETFAVTAARRRVGVIVVDVDRDSLAFLHNLHLVFPSVRLVAVSSRPHRLTAAKRAGARLVLPRRTPARALGQAIDELSRRD